MLKQLLLIGTGGFIGSVARFLVSRLNTRIDWLSIPIGTLTVNVLGSLLYLDSCIIFSMFYANSLVEIYHR